MAEERKSEGGTQAPSIQDAFSEVLELLRGVDPSNPDTVQDVNLDAVVEQLETALGALNTQMEEVYKDTGMNKQELEEYSANPENFSKEEWKLLQEIRGELGKFQEQAEEAFAKADAPMEGAGEEEPKRRRRRKRKDWIQG